MAVAADLISNVVSLLDLHGQSVTFRRVNNAGYDVSTGTVGSSSNDDETVRVHFQNYRDNQIDGAMIQRGDRMVILSPEQTDGTALSKRPQIGDFIVGEQDTVTVVNARPVMSGTSVVYWQLQVRG